MRRSYIGVLLFLPAFALAGTIAVHNTGVDSSDVLVGAGAQTAFWTLSAEPAGASEALGSNPFRYFNGAYFADTSTAAWVSPGANGTAGAGGFYTYDLVIDLTGSNPATASVGGIFGTDNDGSISLNSGPAVATTCFACFGTPTPFTINSGFVSGLNTIHVTVDNGGDPTAFFVEFNSTIASGASGVPEPSAILLTCAGLAGLIVLHRTARRPR